MRPRNPKDTDYDVKSLLTKRELKDFKGEATKDPAKIAVLEARQQERERQSAAGMKVPDKAEDAGPLRYQDIHGRRPDGGAPRRRIMRK